MTDPAIRLGCLELAAQLCKPTGNYDADSVVKIAMLLYTFTQASTQPQAASTADKPSKAGKKGAISHPDILT
jgi:hypothetical protein